MLPHLVPIDVCCIGGANRVVKIKDVLLRASLPVSQKPRHFTYLNRHVLH